MIKLYCQYCGELLSEGCNCEREIIREISEHSENLIGELEQRPETQTGWTNEDLCNSRFSEW